MKYPLLRTQRCQRFFLFRDDVPSADDIYLFLPYIYSNARCEVRNAIQISGVVFLAKRVMSVGLHLQSLACRFSLLLLFFLFFFLSPLF